MMEKNRFGMWLFLAMEMLFFSALILLFLSSYFHEPVAFRAASTHLNRVIAVINTVLLLTGSLLVAIAVDRQKHWLSNRLSGQVGSATSRAAWLITAAMICGIAFLALKLFEYHLDAQDGILPGVHYEPKFALPPAARLFYCFYFLGTLIHFAHLTIGCGWLGILALRARVEKLNEEHAEKLTSQVEIAGLYWHFVDVVWVFLLPLFYLLK